MQAYTPPGLVAPLLKKGWSYFQCTAGGKDVQTYTGPVAEGKQKKDGNRPPPAKPDTSEKEKPEREGDKGSQRAKKHKKEDQS